MYGRISLPKQCYAGIKKSAVDGQHECGREVYAINSIIYNSSPQINIKGGIS